MLAYDHDCPNCGIREVLQRHQEHDTCPDCSSKVRVILFPVPTHGIVFSNAEVNNQLGTRWESNAEKRAWLKAHPKALPMEKGSAEDKDFSMTLQHNAYNAVNKAGFKDVREFKSELKQKAASDKNSKQPGG